MSRFQVCLLLFYGLLLPGFAEEETTTPPDKLTLERIFVEKEFKSKSFSVHWREDGQGYTFLEEIEDQPGQAIWRFKPGKDQEPQVMVASSELIPFGTENPLDIEDYAFSDDESLLLIYTNSKRVWRRNTRGDYWVLDRASGVLRRLGGEAPPSSLMFAKFSPNGRSVAYVRERNLYVEDLIDHSVRALTTTESENIINGTSDWVYEEELGVRDGFRWSPDSQAIAYWQFDESDVPKYTMVDQVSELYPKLISFGYPKVGQTNAACRIGVVSLADGQTKWMNVPGDPRNHYLARMEWAADAQELVIQQLNRAQNTNTLFLTNIHNGSVNPILTERDEAWVDVHDEMFWVRDGAAFTWISDRDGWRHVYLASRDGTEISCLTPGAFDVIRLLKVDSANRWAYFIASPNDPTQRYLYRVGLDGSGFTRLTPRDAAPGTYTYNLSPNGDVAVMTYSTIDDPPVTRLISLPDHKILRELELNEKLREKVETLSKTPTEFFQVDIGEAKLPALCTKPPNFDPEKTYPLLLYVYGEPAGQVVANRWGRDRQFWQWMLAQEGYLIMSIDNQGTAVPAGRAWRKSAFRKVGISAPQEQATALREVLKTRPYIDPKRIGVWGWSGGGSMTLNLMFKYPDLYQTGMAIAAVPNQRYYDTIYQERYMGLPGENVEGYHDGSPIHFADQLEGNLLIIHGAADDNCHYQTFEKLVDQLVRHNKPFTMMTYPRGTHSIKEGKNTTLHLYSLMTRYLHQNLPTD